MLCPSEQPGDQRRADRDTESNIQTAVAPQLGGLGRMDLPLSSQPCHLRSESELDVLGRSFPRTDRSLQQRARGERHARPEDRTRSARLADAVEQEGPDGVPLVAKSNQVDRARLNVQEIWVHH